MSATSIGWTDMTLNPVIGCTHAGYQGADGKKVAHPGCLNCYAEGVCSRKLPGFTGHNACSKGGKWTGEIEVIHDRLAWPFTRKEYQPRRDGRQRRCFLTSLSDMGHPGLAESDWMAVQGMMLLAPWIIWQDLTKRPDRQRTLLEKYSPAECALEGIRLLTRMGMDAEDLMKMVKGRAFVDYYDKQWSSFPHIHRYVSVSDQATADALIPELLKMPCAVRGVSMEPLLSAVNVLPWLQGGSNNERSRISVSSTNSTGLVQRGHGGACVASYEMDSGRDICPTNDGMQGESGTQFRCIQEDRIPHEERAADGICTQDCVDGHAAQGDSRWDGDQSHRRGQTEQFSKQSGTCDQGGEYSTQFRASKSFKKSSIGGKQRICESNRRDSSRDSISLGNKGNESARDEHKVWDRSANNIEYCASKYVEAPKLNHVIVGGESGRGKGIRPFALEWALDVIQQCERAGVPCFVKQMGSIPFAEDITLWADTDLYITGPCCRQSLGIAGTGVLFTGKGDNPLEWPKTLRVQMNVGDTWKS